MTGVRPRFPCSPSIVERVCRKPWSDPGFSLLELLVVLMLMAIIAAVTLPIFGPGVSTTDLKRSAREIAAGLRLARSQAIAQRTEATLELDLAARAFRVLPDPRMHTMPEGIDGRITLAAGERKFDVDIDWLTGRVSILE